MGTTAVKHLSLVREVRSLNSGDIENLIFFYLQSLVKTLRFKLCLRLMVVIWTDVSNNWMVTLECQTGVSNKSVCTGNPGLYYQEASLIQLLIYITLKM